MTIEHPGKKNQRTGPEGWDWTEEDRKILEYESGNTTYALIIGEHEHYGEGVFALRDEETKWVLEEILGRPTQVLGFARQDEQ